jgi:hypothetical protein
MFATKGSRTKYFTKQTLFIVNEQAIKTDRNRTLEPKALKTLRDDLIYPVVFNMIHNDREMRVGIMVGDVDDPVSATMVFLDIPFETYNVLPTVESK